MLTIAIANRKGGVGKTTIACALATKLSESDRVLLIDLDSQANATDSMSVTPSAGVAMWLVSEELGNVTALSDNLSVLPGSPKTALVRIGESAEDLATVKRGLRGAQDRFDYIILDCPPSFSALTKAAIFASDYVLCPTVLEYLSIAGVRQLIVQVGEMVLQHPDCNIRIMGIQPNKLDTRTNEHKAHLTDLVKAYGAHGHKDGGLVWPPLRQTIAVSTASSVGRPIWSFLKDTVLEDWQQMVERVKNYG